MIEEIPHGLIKSESISKHHRNFVALGYLSFENLPQERKIEINLFTRRGLHFLITQEREKR